MSARKMRNDGLNMFVDVGVQEGHVHPKWFVGGRFTLLNLFFENMRVHASAAQQAKPSGITDGTG